MDSFQYSLQNPQFLLCFAPLESSPCSGFCTWSYKHIELWVRGGSNEFISSGKPCLVLCSSYGMLHCGELVTRLPFTTVVVCFVSLGWGWYALVWTIQHMSVHIGKGGCASCSTLSDWLSFEEGVFKNVGASYFYIHASLKKFLHAYPTIVRVLRVVATSAHRTATLLVLHFRICLEIHPPLTIHHMSVAPLPLLLRNAMT